MNIGGIARVLAAALVCGLMATGAGARDMDARGANPWNAVLDQVHAVKIPAQPLNDALSALENQTGTRIMYIYFADVTNESGIKAMEGRYSIRQALELMLEDTGFDAEVEVGDGSSITVYINPAEPKEDTETKIREGLALEGGEDSAQIPAPKKPIDDGSVIEEVIVTGGLHDIASMASPHSTTTVTFDLIKDMGALSITDIYTVVPGFNVRSMQDGEYRYNIRGIASQTGTDGFAPIGSATSVYLDGTPVTSTLGPQTQTAGMLFDIDRIEILKGPQGTLLGEGSLAGTVRYTYKRPDAGSHIIVVNTSVADVSSTDDTSSHVNAVVNLPLTRDTALRLASWQVREAGFIDNLEPWEPDFNDGRASGGRIALKHGTDHATVIGSIYHGKQETLGGSATVDSSYLSLTERLVGKRPFSRDEVAIYSLDVEVDLQWVKLQSMTSFADRAFGANTETTRDARTLIDFAWGGTRAVEDLSRCWLFAPCPDFSGLFNFIDPDNPSTIGDGWNMQNYNEISDHSSKYWVQELHLAAPLDRRLHWSLGLFWKDGKSVNSDIADVVYSQEREDTFGVLFDAIKVSPHNIHTDLVREYATFGQVRYDMSDHWEAAVGLRYSNVKQYFSVANRHTEDHPLTGKLVLSWRPDNDLLTYLSMATGQRPGNVNGHMEFAVGLYEQQFAKAKAMGRTDVAQLLGNLRNQALSRRFFDGDRVTHYELGAKAIAFGGNVRLVAAAYFVEWRNMIVLEQDRLLRDHVEPISTFNINSGGAQIHGFEFELGALLTDRLRMRFTADTNGSKMVGKPLFGNRVMRTFNPTPQWTLSLTVDYTRLLAKEWIVYYRLNHAQVGEQGNILPYHKTNGRIVLSSRGSPWHIALFANNLTNEKLASDAQSRAFWWHSPRQVGLELGYGDRRRAGMR